MLLIELVALCGLFWGACWLGTGGDRKNLYGFRSYPNAVQNIVRSRPELAGKIRQQRPAMTFVGNLLLFAILLFGLGLLTRREDFAGNFLNALLLGQGFNLFDLVVIDLLWWRHAKRVRFSGTENRPELYADPGKHISSFLRGIVMFLLVAIFDGWLLTWI